LAVFASIHLIAPRGLAFGDVHLALPVGCGVGCYGAAAAIFGVALGFMLAGVVTGILLLTGRTTRDPGEPLGS
jgi:leader peptidase (prepilin peptidase)/N-methyltransferase